MAVSQAQEIAFSGGTFGLEMFDFQFTILMIFYGSLYIWAGWLIYTQWVSWSNRKISAYDFLVRSVRCVLVTVLASFLSA